MSAFKRLLVICLAPAIAFGDDTLAPRIELGSKFAAADTLACGDESSDDAKDCLSKLSWPSANFSVQLDAAEPGCGDYLVRFPSPRPIGNKTNDLVSMEWFAAHDADRAITNAAAIVVVHESGSRMTIGRLDCPWPPRARIARISIAPARLRGSSQRSGRLASAERFRRCNRQLPMCAVREMRSWRYRWSILRSWESRAQASGAS